MTRRVSIRILILIIALLVSWGQSDNHMLIASDTQGSFNLPVYEKFMMKNGLTVYLMEQHEVPLIYISMVAPAGAAKDNGKYGLAYLTAEGLLFGTKSYTKHQIEETLDFLGADYNTSASKEFATITMSFVNKDWVKVFPLLKEIIVDPVFEEVEFDKRKTRLLSELEQAREQPSAVIGSYFIKFLFQDHMYGNPTAGTQSTVSEITIDDVKVFYESNYHPSGSAIAIVGDFKAVDMKKRVKKLFEGWKAKGSLTVIDEKPVPTYDKSRLLLVNKDDATETRFQIGGFGIRRSNPDFVAVQVINTIFGGRFTSWLNDELRVNRGLTYGAGSYFSSYKHSGAFRISSFTRTEKTIEAIDVALEVLDRLYEQGVDDETLTSAKNYIKGQYPPRFETAGSLASLLTQMFVYGFDESFINDFQKNVDEMTIEKANVIIAKYFSKDCLQFVLIGKASEIRDLVKKYGEIEEKEIMADGF